MAWWFSICAIGICLILIHKKNSSNASVSLPSTSSKPLLWPVRYLSLILYSASFLFMALAAVQSSLGNGPLSSWFHLVVSDIPPSPSNSRFILFVVDRSGSMAEAMPGNPEATKMETIKEALNNSIVNLDSHGGIHDLLGLITVARVALIEVPLTRDRTFLQHEIADLSPETVDRLNGTALGYAIFKSSILIAACRSLAQEEKGISMTPSTVILITDGLEEPNPADRGDRFRSMRAVAALNAAKENKVKVQYINVDKNSYLQLSADERDRIEQAVEATGGKYYECTPHKSLEEILSSVILEEVPQEVVVHESTTVDASFLLLLCSLLFISLARLLETAIVRVYR